VEMEHLSRCRGSVGEPGGGLPFWGLWKICNGNVEETSAHVFVWVWSPGDTQAYLSGILLYGP
jgi:hypothetical protein